MYIYIYTYMPHLHVPNELFPLQERLDAIHSALSSRGAVHLSAVAGAGKTFVALRLVLDELRTKKGQVLFVAPSLGLGFHFVRWLMQILGIFFPIPFFLYICDVRVCGGLKFGKSKWMISLFLGTSWGNF